MTVKRSTVYQNVEFDKSELDGKLTEVIFALQKTLSKIPVQYQSTAEIDVNAYDDYGCSYVSVDITYMRPETDEEFEHRHAREKALEESIRESERVEFNRLKAKFGG